MSEVKIPKVGDSVIFYPDSADKHCRHNGAEKQPATVVQAWGNKNVNLSVPTMNPDGLLVVRWSVGHKSESVATQAHWAWPDETSMKEDAEAASKLPVEAETTE